MRDLFVAMIAGVLSLPGLVQAQPEQGLPVEPNNETDLRGVVRGRAVRVDLSHTLELVIDTDSGLVKLSALPTQIADLNPGDIVAFRYRDYGGTLWIELEPPGTPGVPQISPGSFGQMGMASGMITKLNKSWGQLVVHGLAFRAHPQTLQNLLPGQFVDVTYVQFGKVYGAVAIQPIAAAQGPSTPDENLPPRSDSPAESQPGSECLPSR